MRCSTYRFGARESVQSAYEQGVGVNSADVHLALIDLTRRPDRCSVGGEQGGKNILVFQQEQERHTP